MWNDFYSDLKIKIILICINPLSIRFVWKQNTGILRDVAHLTRTYPLQIEPLVSLAEMGQAGLGILWGVVLLSVELRRKELITVFKLCLEYVFLRRRY